MEPKSNRWQEYLYQGMRMRHSIIPGECCTPAHADTGLCSWTLDTGWWRLHADTVATTDTRPRHCHVTRPSLGRLLGCRTKDKKYPAQPPRYPGWRTAGRWRQPHRYREGGDKTSICTTYVILVDIQGGFWFKMRISPTFRQLGLKKYKVCCWRLLSLPVPELSGYWRQVSAVLVCRWRCRV